MCVNLKPDLAEGALSLAVGKLYARSLTDGRVVTVAELGDALYGQPARAGEA